MLSIRTTQTFDRWYSALRDNAARIRIQVRIDRMLNGNPGDVKALGGGIFEMRVDHGPGYRIYIQRRGEVLVVLLCGGNKSTQRADIERARHLAVNLDLE
ncbi:type II toxin-antitoxin system RelE/ParE family toxin [Cupriavidus taiwanensis]|uniref:type II toxin-antitoxin system RelE/ParE family toxin n=1 Tax=Cupriavidus taiwanensis TaxID=164546 RepID=UPI000E2043E6|nr:type II toxin-antitoxin system RelE/ParE family toxin [Cupriavidus taiwanensis]